MTISCIEEYAKQCLFSEERHLVEVDQAISKIFNKLLCDDPEFQAEFLKHAPCLKKVSKDLDKCVKRRGNRRKDGLKKALLEFCGGRNETNTCTYAVSSEKCSGEDTDFLKKMADITYNLTVHSEHCLGVDLEQMKNSIEAAGRPTCDD